MQFSVLLDANSNKVRLDAILHVYRTNAVNVCKSKQKSVLKPDSQYVTVKSYIIAELLQGRNNSYKIADNKLENEIVVMTNLNNGRLVNMVQCTGPKIELYKVFNHRV